MSTGRIRVVLTGFMAVLCVATGTRAQSPAPPTRPSAYSPAGDPQRGERSATGCVPCHSSGAPALGDPPVHAPRLRHQRASAIFYALQDYKSGHRNNLMMRTIAASLSDQDMRDLSVYLAGERTPIPHASLTGAHDEAASVCAFCHGETGLGEMDGYPVLTGQHLDYLEKALADYCSGLRSNPTMSVIAKEITQGQAHALAEYFSAYTALEPIPPVAAESTGPTAVAASIKLIDIGPGEFVMGTDAMPGEQQGFPPHTVTIPAFRLGATLITFDQYDAFSNATRRPSAQDEGWGRGSRPVININRGEMLAFIRWLNVGGHRHFRLPTEAEFEYATRAGTTTPYFWGDGTISDYANTVSNTGRDVFPYTSPVGSFLPNPWGLFDIIGNVWEMTQDCRHPNFVGAPTNGDAWMGEPCDSYMVRGGWYRSVTRGVQVTSRSAASASFRSTGLGFRIAESLGHPD